MTMMMRKYAYEGESQSGRVRNKLRIPLVASFFIMILGFSGIVTSMQSAHLEKNILEKIREVEDALKNHIAIDTAAMIGFINLIKENNDLKNALIAEDRNLLLALSKGFYADLKKDFNITHFYFHNISRTNILRVHKPTRFGDQIKRFTARKAEKTQSNAHGVEIGVLGQYTLRVVSPWFDEKGQLIGYIELGEEIDHVIKTVSNLMGMDIVSFLYKSSLDQDSWTNNLSAQHKKRRQWDDYENFAVTHNQ